jgi:hypothetical protein
VVNVRDDCDVSNFLHTYLDIIFLVYKVSNFSGLMSYVEREMFDAYRQNKSESALNSLL